MTDQQYFETFIKALREDVQNEVDKAAQRVAQNPAVSLAVDELLRSTALVDETYRIDRLAELVFKYEAIPVIALVRFQSQLTERALDVARNTSREGEPSIQGRISAIRIVSSRLKDYTRDAVKTAIK